MIRVTLLNILNKYFFAIIGILICLFFIYAFFVANKNTIYADGVGYFSYPYELLTKGNLTYQSKESQNIFGVVNLSEDQNLNKYPIGTGLLLIPAYLAGELINNTFYRDTSTSITSKGFQIAVGINGIIFLLIGLLFLRKVLTTYFSLSISNITLLVITFSTNLFVYASADASFSHVYSFFSISVFLYYLIKWHEEASVRNSFGLALGIGLSILIRPANITLILLFILYGIDYQDLRESSIKKLKLLKSRTKNLILIIFISSLIIVPQIIYWYSTTNKFIIYSYVNESFNFLQPQIVNVLVSIKRGVFFWHPIILIAVTSVLKRTEKLKSLYLGFGLFLLTNLYIIASWWFWDYGIGFGHRAFTDYIPIFAVLLAALFNNIKNIKSKDTKILFGIMILILICNNLMLSISYVQERNSERESNVENYLDSILKFHL